MLYRSVAAKRFGDRTGLRAQEFDVSDIDVLDFEVCRFCYLSRGPAPAGRVPAAPGIPTGRPDVVTDRLEGKVAFITGAGTGIGRSASELFAGEGARVVVAEIDAASGAETEERIRSAGGEAVWVETDVTDAGSVRAAFERAVDRFGRLDVLYNNAGGSTTIDGPVTEAPEEEFWRVIRLDLFGTFLGCKYGIPRLIESGGGSVINTSSNVALMAVRGRDCYTAAKGAVASMTRSMAAEYAEHGVRVTRSRPGRPARRASPLWRRRTNTWIGSCGRASSSDGASPGMSRTWRSISLPTNRGSPRGRSSPWTAARRSDDTGPPSRPGPDSVVGTWLHLGESID